jgi:uncharacterized membrane protein YdbT with pleckstrin-like domain
MIVLLVGGLAWMGLVWWGWLSQDYIVTNRRVLKVEGILTKRSADSSLEKINDAVLEQSVLGRMLGYGDLEILTAAEESVDRYHRLADATRFKRTMLDAKHELESGVGRPASPTEDITNALKALADLRDRGAIGVDEYEAKKKDLLARL